MAFATVDLWGRFAHNRRVQQTPQPPPFDRSRRKMKFLRESVIRKFVGNIDEIAGQQASVVEEARENGSHSRGGTCGTPGGETDSTQAWVVRTASSETALLSALDKKWEARRHCKTKHTTATWKAFRAACKDVRAAKDKGIEIHLEEYVAELETLLRHRDMRDLYKHLNRTVDLGGRKKERQQAIKDENGNLLRDKGDILRRWERFFGNLLNTKSPALQPFIIEKVQ